MTPSWPRQDVVYIFEREGARGGPYWLLVLACGHSAARPRQVPTSLPAMAQAMFRPMAEKFAPRRVQCLHCGSGCAKRDPWILIAALGGPKDAGKALDVL